MPKLITAIYEDGVFKPLRKPSLKDKQRVTLEVRPTRPPRKRRAPIIPSRHPALAIVGLFDGPSDLSQDPDQYLYGERKRKTR